MKIVVDKYYRTRNGDKAHVVYERKDGCIDCPMIGYIEGKDSLYSWTKLGTFTPSGIDDYRAFDIEAGYRELISEWEDEPETINMSERWLLIFREDNSRYEGEVVYMASEYSFREKPKIDDYSDITIAVVTVKDWQSICAGERDLIKGEGLDNENT